MWKCVPPKDWVPSGFFTKQELWHRAAGFPSFSLSIFRYKAAVNLHSWNHFPLLKKRGFFQVRELQRGECPAHIQPWLSCGLEIFFSFSFSSESFSFMKYNLKLLVCWSKRRRLQVPCGHWVSPFGDKVSIKVQVFQQFTFYQFYCLFILAKTCFEIAGDELIAFNSEWFCTLVT